MVYSFAAFTALLKALQLTQDVSKPSPQAGPRSFSVNDSPLAVASTNLSVGHAFLAGRSAQDVSCDAQSYTAAETTETFAPFDQAQATIFRYRQQQSVNLGSWFVHENWMTPSLFQGASGKKLSELDIASGWGSTDCARSVLERHWDTFITENDFKYLDSIGINTVRLPIGYWSLGPDYCHGTPFDPVSDVYRNAWSRVMRAINMAANYKIGVLVDLHGAVGSQNGQPHSGISDSETNLFDSQSNVDKTVNVLTSLVEQLANVTNVVGIQMLNEPQDVPELEDFYTRALTAMRQVPAAAAFPIYLHNGFDLQRFTGYVANRPDFVVQDHHSYFVFTSSDDEESASNHTGNIRGPMSETLQWNANKERGNLIIGEWSCALTPKSLANEPDPLQAQREFCTAQMEVYANTTAGWSFWSYLKEECDGDLGWCFKSAVGNVLPGCFFSYSQPQMDDSQRQSRLDNIRDMTPPSSSDVLAKFQQDATSSSLSGRTSRLDVMSQSGNLYHRYEAVHLRHRRQDTLEQREAVQRSIVQGYNDGHTTAKKFAVEGNLSKLGFVGQHMFDNIQQLGSLVVAPGTEDSYRQGFVRGVQDAEAIIELLLQS